MERWVIALVAACCVSCAKPAPPVVAVPPKTALVALPAPHLDLAEHANFASVGLPSEVLAWVHLPAPGRDLPVLGQLAGIGEFFDPNELIAQKLGSALGAALDLDKPVDLLGVDDGAGGLALLVAAGIADAAAFARQTERDFGFEPVATGRFRVIPRGAALDPKTKCELWLAPPTVGARLICAEHTEMIEHAAPFLMGAAQTSATPAAVHLEVPAQALAYAVKKGGLIDPKPSANQSRSERAGNELGRGLVLDTVAAMNGVNWDVTLHDSSVDIAQEVRFQNTDALLPLAVSGRSGPHPTVPDAFWRLPTDSDLTLYSEGADPEPLRKAWARLVPSFVTGMGSDLEFPEKASAELEQALENLAFRGGAWELAHGQDLQHAADALAGSPSASSKPLKPGRVDPELQRVNAQLGGWLLLGLEDDPHALLDSLRRGLKVASKDFPRKKDAESEPVTPSIFKMTETALRSGGSLPAGTLHWVLTVRPNEKYVTPVGAKPAPEAATWHVIAAPEAQRLWISIARDEASATRRLHALLAADPSHSIGADDALRKLAIAPPSGLGYVTLASFIGLSLSAESQQDLADSRQLLSRLWATAGKGRTEMPVWVTADGGGSTPRRVSLNVRLPPAAIADLLQLAMTAKGGSD